MYHVSVQGVDERVINVLSTLSLFFTKGLKEKGVTVKTVENGSGNQKRVAFPSKFVVATDISLALGLERMVVVFVPEGSLTKLTGKLRKEKEKEKRKRKKKKKELSDFPLCAAVFLFRKSICCLLWLAYSVCTCVCRCLLLWLAYSVYTCVCRCLLLALSVMQMQYRLSSSIMEYTLCCWSLLNSAILRSRSDSLCYDWLALCSAFLNIHRSGVLTALAWQHGATWNCCRLGASSVYTTQPCTMSLHAKPHT